MMRGFDVLWGFNIICGFDVMWVFDVIWGFDIMVLITARYGTVDVNYSGIPLY